MKTLTSLASFALVAVALAHGGCACSPGTQPPAVAPADVAAALCVAKVVREVGDPRTLAPEAAVALALRVAACLPKAPLAPAQSAPDAGADGGR
jgi:hypothetical protein